MRKALIFYFAIQLFSPYVAFSQGWKNECISYYQLQLPENIEVALYPIGDLVSPRNEPEYDGEIKTKRYARTGITFEETYYGNRPGDVQAQFSKFYYSDYELDISSGSKVPVDFFEL